MMNQDFVEGGMAMYPIALLGCLGLGGGLIAFVLGLTVARARTALLAIGLMALGCLAPMVGGLGFVMGTRAMEQALAHVNPEDADLIRMVGTAEAMTNLQYGLAAGLAPFCLGLALLGLGLSRRRPGVLVLPAATGV
jgi:hypothetical protein